MNCLCCDKNFKPKNSVQKYCSKSCSQKQRTRDYRNSLKIPCPICKLNLMTPSSKSCKNCRFGNSPNITLQEIYERYNGRHKSWAFAHIRKLGRTWNKKLTKSPCSICGYFKHVEICHIKPISSFDKTATLGEVHSPDNVIALCPNCHWEFDNL